MPIVTSLLDQDLYKFVMQRAVFNYCSGVPVEYKFFNRRPEKKFTQRFLARLNEEIAELCKLKFTTDEAIFVTEYIGSGKNPYHDSYYPFLSKFQFEEKQVKTDIIDGELSLTIKGDWQNAILWEVPLMAIISEIYFEDLPVNTFELYQKLAHKTTTLSLPGQQQGCRYSEFGTRRRRSKSVQEKVIRELMKHNGFLGTSNVMFAKQFGVKPIGTMAHEWFMGISALEGLRHANRHALQIWKEYTNFEKFAIALSDTFGTNAFFNDFESYHLFNGVRHDSGDPFEFTQRVIHFYESKSVCVKSKTIVFSDNIKPEIAVELHNKFSEKINVVFGIGTNFTNDFDDAKPLNMVIKMTKCDNVPVVKLSDDPGKATGDPDALRVARWTFYGTPLDAS